MLLRANCGFLSEWIGSPKFIYIGSGKFNKTTVFEAFDHTKFQKKECNKYGTKKAKGRKNKSTVILKTGRFDYIDSAVIISSVSEAMIFIMT